MLLQVFEQLAIHVEARELAFLMPWTRELIQQWMDEYPQPEHSRGKLSKVRIAINKDIRDILNKDIRDILNEKPLARFPLLTSNLNTLCLSGRALFAQYRLLESSYKANELELPPVTIERGSGLVPLWVHEDLDIVTTDWKAAEFVRSG